MNIVPVPQFLPTILMWSCYSDHGKVWLLAHDFNETKANT
jgi:hypothetical protein